MRGDEKFAATSVSGSGASQCGGFVLLRASSLGVRTFLYVDSSIDEADVSVTPVADVLHRGDVLAMVLRASGDAELCDATYLPAGMGAADAQRWLAACEDLTWVVWCGGVPCGFLGVGALHGSIGVELGEGVLEREVWLEAQWRGRGVIRAAMQCVIPVLRAHGVRAVLGVAWEENSSAVRAMANGGFTRVGRVWWEQGDSEPGWCEAWVFALDDQRGERR